MVNLLYKLKFNHRFSYPLLSNLQEAKQIERDCDAWFGNTNVA